MDNCGGGQRLPPDGDEFPAAYQEFGGNGQQYRFVTTSTARTSTMIANGRLVCNESDTYATDDGFKLLESNVVAAAGIISPADTGRITGLTSVENVCQEVSKIELPGIEINGKMSGENVCQDTGGGVLAREGRDDFVKKAPTSVTNYQAASYGTQADGNVLVSEKKIEITGYYHKDVPVLEEVQDSVEKDALDTPPPLPLTGKSFHPCFIQNYSVLLLYYASI